MPWRYTNVIDERRGFVRDVGLSQRRMRELCAVYNINSKTGYKLWQRYQEQGEAEA